MTKVRHLLGNLLCTAEVEVVAGAGHVRRVYYDLGEGLVDLPLQVLDEEHEEAIVAAAVEQEALGTAWEELADRADDRAG